MIPRSRDGSNQGRIRPMDGAALLRIYEGLDAEVRATLEQQFLRNVKADADFKPPAQVAAAQKLAAKRVTKMKVQKEASKAMQRIFPS